MKIMRKGNPREWQNAVLESLRIAGRVYNTETVTVLATDEDAVGEHVEGGYIMLDDWLMIEQCNITVPHIGNSALVKVGYDLTVVKTIPATYHEPGDVDFEYVEGSDTLSPSQIATRALQYLFNHYAEQCLASHFEAIIIAEDEISAARYWQEQQARTLDPADLPEALRP